MLSRWLSSIVGPLYPLRISTTFKRIWRRLSNLFNKFYVSQKYTRPSKNNLQSGRHQEHCKLIGKNCKKLQKGPLNRPRMEVWRSKPVQEKNLIRYSSVRRKNLWGQYIFPPNWSKKWKTDGDGLISGYRKPTADSWNWTFRKDSPTRLTRSFRIRTNITWLRVEWTNASTYLSATLDAFWVSGLRRGLTTKLTESKKFVKYFQTGIVTRQQMNRFINHFNSWEVGQYKNSASKLYQSYFSVPITGNDSDKNLQRNHQRESKIYGIYRSR